MRALCVAAAAAALTLGPIPVWAQVPRAADGKPDLTGVWQAGNTQRGTWQEANGGLGVGGSGSNPSAPVALPTSDRAAGAQPAPYQPWAVKKVLDSYNKRAIDDPTGLCLPPGIPRLSMTALFPQQIIQTPTQIVILYEYMGVFRVIPLNVPHPDDLLPSFIGHSVGRWDGDTLVVDVVGFNDKTWISGAGTFHSEALHVVERFTRVTRDQINYEATVEDPNVLTKPWTLRTTMMLREGTRLEEYVCAENNVDAERLEKLLKDGVRFQR
jgi:hypothetical protein